MPSSCSTIPIRSRSSRSPVPGSKPSTLISPLVALAVALADLAERGLARAVRAEQAEHLAAADLEVHARQRLDLAVALANSADLHRCVWRASHTGRSGTRSWWPHVRRQTAFVRGESGR